MRPINNPANNPANTPANLASDVGGSADAPDTSKAPTISVRDASSSSDWQAKSGTLPAHIGSQQAGNTTEADAEKRAERDFTQLADWMAGPDVSADQIARRIAELPPGSKLPASCQGLPLVSLALKKGCNTDLLRQLLLLGARADVNDEQIRDSFVKAVCAKDLAAVRLLLDAMEDSSGTKALMQHALGYSIMLAEPTILRLLLRRGANPELPVAVASSAFAIAIDTEEFSVIGVLLEHSSEAAKIQCAAHLRSKLVNAVARGDHDYVKRLLAGSGLRTDLTRRLFQGDDQSAALALCTAASRGDETMVLELLHYGASASRQDTTQRTPLMYACANNHTKVVERLLSADLMGNIVKSRRRDAAGFSALGVAAWSGSPAVFDLLLKRALSDGVSIDDIATDPQGNWSLIELLISRGDPAMLALLLNAGLSPDFQPPGRPPILLMCAHFGRNDCLRLLLESGANIDLQDGNGRSALSVAVRAGQTDIVKALLRAGARQLPESTGQTPLAIARGLQQQAGAQPSPYREISELLLSRSASGPAGSG